MTKAPGEPASAKGARDGGSAAEIRIHALRSIGEIAANDWNACANPIGDLSSKSSKMTAAAQPISEIGTAAGNDIEEQSYNPFISHAFLSSLEDSGSVGGRSGWQVQHLLVKTIEGALLGVAPCYAKSHSRGEYVFDRGWAEAYERAGGAYYPKLQVAVPFTPATGRRLLVRPGAQADIARQGLAAGLVELARLGDASGVHVTFATEDECAFLGERGFLRRTDQQFHWANSGYATFDDFLAALSARKRKTIKRERRDAVAADVTVHWLTGSDLTESVWDAFFQFYMETGSRKWGRPYLTRSFYSLVGERMGDQVLLVMAKRAGRWIAGAINFIGSDTLFGRHWGAVEHHPFLHFECCYYQAIEYAITHRLNFVEAGAQGEHKIARGYMPRTTHSAHYIADPGLRRAIADYLVRERAYVEAAGAELASLAPYRKDQVLDEDSF
jgi:predicted N-acyltransferase